MNPGKLRDEITIQEPSVTVQDNGESIITWSDYATRLASVTTPSVKQFREASQEISQGATPRTMRRNEWLVQVRHDPDIASSFRVRWLDHVLDIDGMTADPKNAVYMFLHCYEITPASQGFGKLGESPEVKITIGGTQYSDGDTYDYGDLANTGDASYNITVDNSDGTVALAVNSTLSGDSEITSTHDADFVVPAGDSEAFGIFLDNNGADPGDKSATLELLTNDLNENSITLTLEYTTV